MRKHWKVMMADLLICLAAAVLIGVICALPALAEEVHYRVRPHSLYVCVEEGSTLNARFAPVNGSVELRLERGEAVEVVSITDGWAEVLIGGTERLYVSAAYLSSEPPADPAGYTVTGNGRVHVRAEPDGAHVSWAQPGDVVTVYTWLDQGGVRWARIDGGYIQSDYLKEDVS